MSVPDAPWIGNPDYNDDLRRRTHREFALRYGYNDDYDDDCDDDDCDNDDENV